MCNQLNLVTLYMPRNLQRHAFYQFKSPMALVDHINVSNGGFQGQFLSIRFEPPFFAYNENIRYIIGGPPRPTTVYSVNPTLVGRRQGRSLVYFSYPLGKSLPLGSQQKFKIPYSSSLSRHDYNMVGLSWVYI